MRRIKLKRKRSKETMNPKTLLRFRLAKLTIIYAGTISRAKEKQKTNNVLPILSTDPAFITSKCE